MREENGITLDINLCVKTISELEPIYNHKFQLLAEAMPKKVIKTAPKCMYKVDKTLSKVGEQWLEFLKKENLPEDTTIIYQNGNPQSVPQIKEWLFSLGWVPKTFKTNDKKEEVPQISLPFGQGLCQSIKDLFDEHPVLKELDSLFTLKHRIGFLESFLESMDKFGKIYCKARGLTKTLRWQHCKPLANMPGVDKPYANSIRDCLTVPNNNYTLFGVDMCALEDTTKQHYIYFFDPKYVEEMRVPGFDPHLDIACLANLITEEQSDFYKNYKNDSSDEDKELYKFIKKQRSDAKQGNFACTYGAGPPKLAQTLNLDLKSAELLHATYWKRNYAVKLTEKQLKKQTVNNQLWVQNPISGIWLFVENEKDLFSAINQSSGVWVFDMFILNCLQQGIIIPFEYHDEILFWVKNDEIEDTKIKLQNAIKQVNNLLKLNVTVDISIQIGKSYGSVH